MHSGQVPKAKILVERRMGNKVLLLLQYYAYLPTVYYYFMHIYMYVCMHITVINRVYCIHLQAVTLLRGLEVFGIDLNALAKDCQKK